MKDGPTLRVAAAAAALLLLLPALPARCGERGGKELALSIRIAEAKNRPGAKKYFQSVARQQKAKRGRAPVERRPAR